MTKGEDFAGNIKNKFDDVLSNARNEAQAIKDKPGSYMKDGTHKTSAQV